MGCDQIYGAVVLMTLTVAVQGVILAGSGANHLDIAPNYAGVLMGITNTVGTVPGFLGPEVVGLYTQDKVLIYLAATNFFRPGRDRGGVQILPRLCPCG